MCTLGMNSSCNYIKKLNGSNGKSNRSENVARAFDRRNSNGLHANRKSGIRGNWAENDLVSHSFRIMDNCRKSNHPKFAKLMGTTLREKSKRESRSDTDGIYIPKEVPDGQEKEKKETSKWHDPALQRNVSVGKLRTQKSSEKIRQSGEKVYQIPHVRPTLEGKSRRFDGVNLCKKHSKGRLPPDENLYYQNHDHSYLSTRFTRKEAKGNKNINDDFDKADDKPKRRGRVTQIDPSDISNKRLDDKPKKSGRVIRIDPYDISNKRLDGGILIPETQVEEENDEKEMSKNALFRAIRPSPSIMSFVENKLLGRRRLIELKRSGYNTDISAPLDNIPHSKGSEREPIEESIFKNKLSFFAAAKISSSFPPPSVPEIAFAGRSNVGKSSLLNSLTRQWGVVRTSDKPGLTQTINFFQLGSKLCLVDLPGYGFAYAKEEIKEAWEELVKEYVSTRDGFKRVCLLIDTKWGMKLRDHELVDLMERSRTKYQIVLTKTDLVFPIDVARRAMQIQESLQANKSLIQPVMMVSSKSGAGIRSLRTVLANIVRFAKP